MTAVKVDNWPVYQSVTGTMLLAGAIPSGSNNIGRVTVDNRADVSVAWTHGAVEDSGLTAGNIDIFATPSAGSSYQVSVTATTAAGYLDLSILESRAAGWVNIYDFPRITAPGTFVSPIIPLTGTQICYRHSTVGFVTHSISRVQLGCPAPVTRQRIDYSIDLAVEGAASQPVWTDLATRNVTLTVHVPAISVLGMSSVAPALTVQASDDAGDSWYAIAEPLTAVTGTISKTIVGSCAQAYRAIITTPSSGITHHDYYVLLRAW